MKRNLFFIATFALLAACSPRVQDAAQTPPTGTIATQSESRVIFPDGFTVRIEIAADDPTREQGLMYRDRLAEDAGMLFFFGKTDEYPFWMKNTLIPLDIIWLDEQRKIVHIGRDIPPCRAEPCVSYAPGAKARYVLEVAAGVAAKHHLAEGSVLRFEGVERVVVR
jgi:uncharacterized membrane protein (UPF0127 family)